MTLHPEHLAAALFQSLAKPSAPSPTGYLVAFSGGLDSTVLLHAIAGLPEIRTAGLRAIHLNHGLQPDAGAWAEACRAFCERLGVAFDTVELRLRPGPGESIEAVAREARYRALAERMRPGELLLTAHHQGDQAETLLLQLLRGSGVSGLAAMPALTRFGPGLLARPLLDRPRGELHGYALEHGLGWVEDQSNADPRFDRNFLRLEVLPLLRRRWPALDRTLSRSARHCAEAQGLIEHWARGDLDSLYRGSAVPNADNQAPSSMVGTADPTGTISVDALGGLPPPRARAALRLWIRDSGLPLPDTARLDRLLHEMTRAGADRNPLVHWPGAEARRYRGRIHLMRPLPHLDPSWSCGWDGHTPILLPAGIGRLRTTPQKGGIDPVRWASGGIRVRLRRDGERCRAAGKTQGRSLKKLLQGIGVPPWGRERIPLIEIDGELAAIGDLLVCEPFAVAPGEPGIRLVWERGDDLGRPPASGNPQAGAI